MTDDTGWIDFGCYGGGGALGHPTPNIDKVAKEGAVFTSWYGQASCTAGRASFMTGRYPIRSALSVVVAPGDPNGSQEVHTHHRRVLQEERLHNLLLGQMASGRQAEVLSDRARLRRDEVLRRLLSGRLYLRRHLVVRTSVVPEIQPEILEGSTQEIVNLYEWEGAAGKPAIKGPRHRLGLPAEFDVRAADAAVEYIKRTPKTTSRSSWMSTS